jgi:hypothetical protein
MKMEQVTLTVLMKRKRIHLKENDQELTVLKLINTKKNFYRVAHRYIS